MAQLTIYLLLAILAAITLVFSPESWEDARGFALGVLGTILFFLVERSIAWWSWIRLWAIAATKYRNTLVRVSASYLYRICIDGQYLLVSGVRIPDQYQPVGGVYKRLPESRTIMSELGVLDDNCIAIDESSRDDIRVRLKGKHLVKFLRWHKEGAGREVETWREFFEELVRPEILPAEIFPYLMTRHVRSIRTNIRYSSHYQSHQILLADVVEPILTDPQTAVLRDLAGQNGTTAFLWATEDLIRARGHDRSTKQRVARISETAEWIL